jgi:hypothetical protein
MAWPMIAAIAIPALISAGAAIYGAVKGSESADKQAKAARDAAEAQMEMFYKNREDLSPWRYAGANALAELQSRLAAGPGEYTKSPGYDWRLGQGIQALDRSAAARGMLKSGAQTKAITRFGQDYATNDYRNWLADWYNSLTPYQSMAGQGLTIAGTIANLGQNAASNQGSNNILAANYGAQGKQALVGGAYNVANIVNQTGQNYLYYKWLNSNPQ